MDRTNFLPSVRRSADALTPTPRRACSRSSPTPKSPSSRCRPASACRRADKRRIHHRPRHSDSARAAVRPVKASGSGDRRRLSSPLSLASSRKSCDGAHPRSARQIVASAAARVNALIEAGADLVIINRFGTLEAGGQGLVDEIALAIRRGIPVVIAVPEFRLRATSIPRRSRLRVGRRQCGASVRGVAPALTAAKPPCRRERASSILGHALSPVFVDGFFRALNQFKQTEQFRAIPRKCFP